METTLSGPEAARLHSGMIGVVGYDVRHEATGDIAPGTRIPGGVIRRAEHPDAYDGFWDDGGGMSGWPAPAGVFQFDPATKVVENTYLIDRLSAGAGGSSNPMAAGDWAEMLVGNAARDAYLPYDVERSNPNGTLQWESAVITRHLRASYGGGAIAMDTMLIRADLLSRGGDVDARGSGMSAPQLVLDLPRVYQGLTPWVGITVVATPASAFITDFEFNAIPAEGRATLDASIEGYLYRAREYRVGKTDIAEWHLPIIIALTLRSPDSTGEPRASASLPAGGEALVSASDGQARRVSVGAGGSVVAGTGIAPLIRGVLDGPAGTQAIGGATGSADTEAQDGSASASGSGTSCADPCGLVRMEEIAAAQAVDATLDAPVDLLQGGRQLGLTLDPDFGGEGILAARSVTRALSGATYADVLAVPSVILAGAPVPLDRSRLVDLRVIPTSPWVNFTTSGQTGGVVARAGGSGLRQGLYVEAVYDVGAERYAFVRFRGYQPDPGKPPYEFKTEVIVVDVSGADLQVEAVQYTELPEAGPVTYQGEPRTAEFSAPASVGTGSAVIEVGQHALIGDLFLSGRGPAGTFTAVDADRALTATPVPDPSATLNGRRVAVYYRAPAENPSWNSPWSIYPRSFAGARILSDARPIGTACGSAQVTDVPAPDAPPFHDIVNGWFDATPEHLLATMQLRLSRADALPDTSFAYEMRWSDGQSTRYATAALDERTRWRFAAGTVTSDGSRIQLAEVGGEVTRPVTAQPGFVRIWVPRSLFDYQDGRALTAPTVHASLSTGEQVVELDAAPNPQGTSAALGGGSTYAVGTCGPG